MRAVKWNNEDIQSKYEDSILNESSKGVRRKVQILDDKIDDFIDEVEKKIEKIEDNPTYQQKLYQMLADANKEHSEFLMAMKRIASTIDGGGKTIPRSQGHANFANRAAFQNNPPEQGPPGPPGEAEQEPQGVNERTGMIEYSLTNEGHDFFVTYIKKPTNKEKRFDASDRKKIDNLKKAVSTLNKLVPEGTWNLNIDGVKSA
jgi:hypothetical protein